MQKITITESQGDKNDDSQKLRSVKKLSTKNQGG